MKIFVNDRNNLFLDYLSSKLTTDFKKKYKIIDIHKENISNKTKVTERYPVLVFFYNDKHESIDLLNYCSNCLKIIICSEDVAFLESMNKIPEVYVINTNTSKEIIYNKILNYIVKFNEFENAKVFNL